MMHANSYATIFKRKSIRKYDLTPLDESTLTEIKTFMGSIKPMFSTIKTELTILSQNQVKGLIPLKAPHYIVAFAEKKDGYLTNIGFMLQQMDLFFSANGLGSCWYGTGKPAKEFLTDSHLEFVIVMAFGKPIEPLHRNNISDFKRKSLAQITNVSGLDTLFDSVRLAPSAINSQPWYFTGNNEFIHAYCVKSSLLKALVYEKMNQIDMGIALCHLWTAARNFDKGIEFGIDEKAKNNPPNGYYYIASVKIQ